MPSLSGAFQIAFYACSAPSSHKEPLAFKTQSLIDRDGLNTFCWHTYRKRLGGQKVFFGLQVLIGPAHPTEKGKAAGTGSCPGKQEAEREEKSGCKKPPNPIPSDYFLLLGPTS